MAKEARPKYVFQRVDVFDVIFNLKRTDVVVMLEFLEHIKRDLLFLQKIPKGITIVASVPSRPARNHVRVFESWNMILDRYGSSMNIKEKFQFPGRDDHKLFLFKATKI